MPACFRGHGHALRWCGLLALLAPARPTLVLLTQQTQSAEHMHAVSHAQAGQRQLLTFEATQSSLVDVNEQYMATHVQSTPTLSLLSDVAFDNETEVWSFSYETMAVDGSVPGQINRYYRVLYLTRAGHDVGASDTANPCLQAGTAYADCLSALRSDYVVLEDAASAGDESARDRLETSSWLCAACAAPVNVTLEPRPFSATQTLRLEIPHAVIRSALARLRNSTRADSPAFAELGTQPALDFGVGVMFLPQPDANTAASPPNNLLIFDMFTVLENTFEQLAIMKQTSYSIATHVAFWTAAAQSDPRIRVVSIEYLLDLGHLLTDVRLSVNNGSLAAGGSMVPVAPADCAAMQALVDALPDARCIARQPLCAPTRYVEGSGADLQTWATVVFPIPEWHAGGEFQFNTLIFSNLSTGNAGRGTPALSTLNFFTSHAPRVACKPAEAVAFDATRHVRAELYRGHLLAAEQIQGTFTVFNDSSLSSAEALVTLVLRPDDTPEALAYFETYADERLRLDELYMSHGKLDHVFPSSVANRVVGSGNGRSTLQLDAELAARCPMLGAPEVGLCVTSKDWGLQGQLARPASSVYYVRQVSGRPEDEQADLAWLADNVFGPSDPATLQAFRAAALARPFAAPAAQARKQYAAVFWVWPVFSWPNTAPVGLVDRTIVSLVWSIAP